jgi:hypothetical protein
MYGRLVDTLTSHNFPLELVGRANPLLEAKSKLDDLNVVKKYLGAKKRVVAIRRRVVRCLLAASSRIATKQV